MRTIFGETPKFPALDVQPQIRALNAQLRARSAVASARHNTKQIGQSNKHAHLIRLGILVGSAAKGLSARWWRTLRSELGLASGLLGRELISAHAEALCRAAVAIRAQAHAAASIVQRARERARNHAVNYVHHFPTRAATARAAALV